MMVWSYAEDTSTVPLVIGPCRIKDSINYVSSVLLVNLSKMVESRKSQATYPDAKTMLNNLLHDHEHVIRTLRADIDACTKYQDAGTTDFLTGLLEQHEKIAWMLRSFLENR